MKKKLYENPITTVVKMQTVGMIATSGFNNELGTTEQSGEDALDRTIEDMFFGDITPIKLP